MMSVFDIFKVAVGPSSSHTVGPMIAAKQFIEEIHAFYAGASPLNTIRITLFGSLASTGIGHCTDKAVLLGLMGHEPRTLDPALVDGFIDHIQASNTIDLQHFGLIGFNKARDILFDPSINEGDHPNTMHFMAFDADGMVIHRQVYYSIGGGFIQKKGEQQPAARQLPPIEFYSANALLRLCKSKDCSIDEIVLQNELSWHTPQDLDTEIEFIWDAMKACINRGLTTKGILPGELKLPRRAPKVHARLQLDINNPDNLEFFSTIDWVNAWALAVNEENAAGGRVVTAPTNGAAGIVPAVLMFAHKSIPNFSFNQVRQFLLTATAFGFLFKHNASISGAEVGCQGEVGSACAMAASGLASVFGGTPTQIENAAEIATEHNLGLTCDPVAGLVQVPCIERNAIAAVKAINAARMALLGDGVHFISFDKVVQTVRETGHDMQSKYKETSQGGLAVNFIEC